MLQNQEKISFEKFIEFLQAPHRELNISGVAGAGKAYVAARLFVKLRKTIVWIVSDGKAARAIHSDLLALQPNLETQALLFPPYNLSPYKKLSYHGETAARRIQTLYRLIEQERPLLLITPVSAVLKRVIPRREIVDYAELLMVDEEVDRDALVEKLLVGGYHATSIAEEPGDFSLRGGILDIFSPFHEMPVRIELFGELVESIRFFSPETQRTTTSVDEALVLPAREALLYPDRMNDILNRLRARAAQMELSVSRVRKHTDELRNQNDLPGIENYMSIIHPQTESFFDFLPSDAVVVYNEPAHIEKAAAAHAEEAHTQYLKATEEGLLCVEPDDLFLSWEDIYTSGPETRRIVVRELPVYPASPADLERNVVYDLGIREDDDGEMETVPRIGDDGPPPISNIADRMRQLVETGFRCIVSCGSRAQENLFRQIMQPYGLLFSEIQSGIGLEDVSAGCYMLPRPLRQGFFWPERRLHVAPAERLIGARLRAAPKKAVPPQRAFLGFGDLRTGDFVVHVDHGIGRYEGIEKIAMEGAENDYLTVAYRDGDRLFLPVDRMNMLQAYMGVEGHVPLLDKLGGKAWEQIKERVRKSADKIAGELLDLYAERSVREGSAFQAPDGLMREFETGFEFEETEDQRKTIEDVLRDMRRPTPMDRLVCGDIGYGKTEVALRAAYLAVSNGKQVAVLVPTTVLAEQHYATFAHRYQDEPFRVGCLSRFRSRKEQKVIVDQIREGSLDIVIGTHRLLSGDIRFKDLGLLVLDEEQRFGVKHKEKLKAIRKTIDVLALTATPIPRTLHLSLVGIRDISVISTPPEMRRPILTYICEFDTAVIRDAVRKEIARGGQIFFVHNRVKTISQMADRLRRLLPDVRVGVAHGQMTENELERVMYRFLKKEIDLLICTTIIESGLDIPAANTILVNRADKFGLSQMYQLRGRVGRSEEQAYAYLFIPGESTLTENARKRLKVLMEHRDLGAGFQIAMNDLKIRGGGAILGASQSGHIAAVGYEMFLELMQEAVARIKGEPLREKLEPEIHLPVSAFLPETYVPDIDQRLLMYRRLARLENLSEISEFKQELEDRYGVMPEEAVHLLLKIMLRILSIQAGVERIDIRNGLMTIRFSDAFPPDVSRILAWVAMDPIRRRLTPDDQLKINLSRGQAMTVFRQAKNILKEITQHVNP